MYYRCLVKAIKFLKWEKKESFEIVISSITVAELDWEADIKRKLPLLTDNRETEGETFRSLKPFYLTTVTVQGNLVYGKGEARRLCVSLLDW